MTRVHTGATFDNGKLVEPTPGLNPEHSRPPEHGSSTRIDTILALIEIGWCLFSNEETPGTLHVAVRARGLKITASALLAAVREN